MGEASCSDRPDYLLLFERQAMLVVPHGVFDLYFWLAATRVGVPCGLKPWIISFGTVRGGNLISGDTAMLGASFFDGYHRKLVCLLNHLDAQTCSMEAVAAVSY